VVSQMCYSGEIVVPRPKIVKNNVRKNDQKVVKKFSKSCQKAVKKLQKVVKKFVKKSCQKDVKKWSKSCQKSCLKVVKKLKIQQTVVWVWGGVEWGNSSSKAFGINFADRPKAKTGK
jgi:uncharacterized UPF0160 family protein